MKRAFLQRYHDRLIRPFFGVFSMISRNLFFNMIVLTASTLALSGCVGAAVGIGAAAVTASSTEKGFSTSVSDGVIKTK